MSKLKSLCSVIVPMRDKPKKFVNEKTGVPWCRIEDIKGKYLYGTTTGRFVDRNTIEQMNLKIFPEGTVICACTGASIGTYAITRRDLITNQTFAGLVCGEKLYNHYLYYFVKLYTKAFIDHSVGCAQAYITRETFENIEISDISFEDQKDIVSLLELLDERIENNKTICDDLEAMAKLIYDYWFVQYDFPDENGRPYKSSGGKMVWNEELKREIPDGWGIGNIIDNPLTSIIVPGVEYFKSKNYLPTANVVGETITDGAWVTYNNRESRANMQPAAYSVWFAKMKSSIKHISIPGDSRWFLDKYILSTGFEGIQCNKQSFGLIHCFVNSEYFETHKDVVAHGATQESVNDDDLKNIKLVVPDGKTLDKFSRIINPILESKFARIEENQQLASLRDFLLPMLMNGQVKVGEMKE